MEPEGEPSPVRAGADGVAKGEPVLSWEALLRAAAKVAGAGPPQEAKAPSMKVLALYGDASASGFGEGAYTLIDSGATHPLRRAEGVEEWNQASPVLVHLAGGEAELCWYPLGVAHAVPRPRRLFR